MVRDQRQDLANVGNRKHVPGICHCPHGHVRDHARKMKTYSACRQRRLPAGYNQRRHLEGLKVGDSIVAGPYQAIRDMRDSTRVKQQDDKSPPKRGPGS